MSELLTQLGINGKLLLSQGVNFLLLLAILTGLLWRPLLRIIDERRKRIEGGLRGADEADRRLREIGKTRDEMIAEADRRALALIHEAEERGHTRHDQIVQDAESHRTKLLAEAAQVAAQRRESEMQNLHAHAKELLRSALARAVALEPAQVDERLIAAAHAEFTQP